MIYLDWASTAFLMPVAEEKMLEAYKNWSNPGALHQNGVYNASFLNKLTKEFKEILNLGADYEIVFTSSATESNNLVFNSSSLPILAFKYAHSSVKNFPEVNFFETTEELIEKISSKRYLISFETVHHECGIEIDLEQIKNLSQKYSFFYHLDASQNKNFKNINDADYITISSHKIGGPIGIALVAFKKNLKPMFFGGGQQKGIRPSTVPIPLIAGFLAALKNTNKDYANLKNIMLENIDQSFFLEKQIQENFCNHIICLLTKNYTGSELLAFLDIHNISVSIGSACTSGALDGVKILKKYGFVPENAIRVSFGWETKEEDILEFCKIFNSFF